MANILNRIASLFGDFAERYELPHKIDPDGQGADLGIHYKNKMISAGYNFAPSEDSYEWVAALGKVNISDIPHISVNVMNSEPIRGVTERITSEGKYVVFGSRDGLGRLSDAEVQRGFMDDVSRITETYDQFNNHISKLRGKR